MSFADYLEKMLIKRGFWSEGDEYIPEDNEKFDFEVECDIYAVAVAFATTVNNQTEPVTTQLTFFKIINKIESGFVQFDEF